MYTANRTDSKTQVVLNTEKPATSAEQPVDSARLLHELQAHQAELEMQNEELRRVEQELSQSRDRYMELYDFAPIGYITIDRDGRITEANITAAIMLGVDRASLIGKKRFSDFVSHEAQDQWFLYQRRIFDESVAQTSNESDLGVKPEDTTLHLQRNDESLFFAHLAGASTQRADTEEVFVTLTDITLAKQAEDAMRENRNALDHAQSIAHIGSWDWNPAGDRITATAEMCRLSDLRQGNDMTVNTFLLSIHPDDRELVERRMAAVLNDSRPYKAVEYRVVHRDGSERILLAHAEVFRNDQGKIVRVLGTAQDVTEERRLQRRIEYLSRFPSEDPNPVLRVLSDGTVKYGNRAAEPVLAAWNTNIHGKTPPTWQMHISNAIKTGAPVTREMAVGNETYSLCIAPLPESGYANIYGASITELKDLHKKEEIAAAAKIALSTTNAMKQGLALIAMNGIVKSVNPALCHLTGYGGADLEGKNVLELIDRLVDPRDREPARRAAAKAIKGLPVVTTQINLLSQDFRQIPIIPAITFIKDDAGVPTIIVLTIQNISDIEAAHTEVREKAERLAEAQRMAHIGNWERGLTYDALTWSDEMYRIFGLENRESGVPYDLFLRSVHPDDRHLVQNAIDTALRDNQPHSFEHRIILPDGRERWVHEHAEVRSDENGLAIRMTGTAQDITARKQAETRDQIAGTISRLFAEQSTREQYLKAANDVLHTWSGCTCLGIRITQEDGKIPFASFMSSSISLEGSECSFSIADDQCICTRIVSGNTVTRDASCLTAAGSFCCNDMDRFLASLSDEERGQFTGRCVKKGFESLAVIPLRHQGRILGVIHVADEKCDRIPTETVTFLENMSPLIGEAVHRFNVETYLQGSEEKYRRLVENLPAMTYTAQLAKTRPISYISPQIETILSFTQDDCIANPDLWQQQMHPEDHDSIMHELQKVYKEAASFTLEYRMIDGGGQTVWLRDRGTIVSGVAGSPSYVQGVMYDITGEKQNETRLRSLASELVLAEERERKRLAVGLHDSINQTLALSKIKLGALSHMLTTEEAKEALQEVRELFSEAVKQTRTLSFELSPPILYELGLRAAVDWLGEKLQKQYGFHFSSSTEYELEDISESLTVLMFQSIRELLTNVGKHAQAKSVHVSLDLRNGLLTAVVKDDGRGFNLDSARKRAAETRSIGLFSLEDRMRHLGGILNVESEIDQGSTITLSAPV